MKRKIAGVVTGLAVLGLASGGVASAAVHGKDHHRHAKAAQSKSRLDDGAQYLSQAKITEQQAIAAAQSAASGALNEIDLEHYQGRLVFNVDVGAHDVKVDARTGDVLGSVQDD